MSNMGYGILSFTISCILLTAKCVSSQNHFVSSAPINQDWIYFVRPTVNQQPLSIQQQAANQQQQDIQWQAANQQQLAIQQQKANQQPLAIQQPTTNQLNIQQRRDQDREDQDYRSTSMMKAKEIIRFGETATALTDFSINLMKLVIQQTPGNTVASPYSIATLLALLQQGSTGATLEQLSEALHMNQQTSAAAYKAHIDDIQKRNSNNTLRIANNIFLANGFNLNNAFRAVALRDFHSDVTLTNFALPTQTAQEINRWVAKKTDNKIDNLISPAALGINTQMVLVNAMYFKGLWQAPFRREATKPGEFLLSNGVIKMAKFMQTRRYYKTGVDSYTGSKVIVVPFELNEYSLMVILPNSLSTVADTLSTLTVSRLEEYSNFPHLETQLELPKFSIKADTDLTPVLKQMGISKLFAGSELSNIGISQASQSPQVSTAVHSAALTIDEEGGSASAATAFAVVALSNDDPSVTFKANRPFLAVLWDGKSKLPLFMAKIEDPTI